MHLLAAGACWALLAAQLAADVGAWNREVRRLRAIPPSVTRLLGCQPPSDRHRVRAAPLAGECGVVEITVRHHSAVTEHVADDALHLPGVPLLKNATLREDKLEQSKFPGDPLLIHDGPSNSKDTCSDPTVLFMISCRLV